MPVTHDGERTVDGVRVGVARLCPLCNDASALRWEDRQLVIWESEPRWAHTGCVNGWLTIQTNESSR